MDLGGPRVGGLDTTYFDYMSFTGTKISHLPDRELRLGRRHTRPGHRGPHTFSASWTGQGEVFTSSVYAFTTTANDEVQLSVGGKPPIEVGAWSH